MGALTRENTPQNGIKSDDLAKLMPNAQILFDIAPKIWVHLPQIVLKLLSRKLVLRAYYTRFAAESHTFAGLVVQNCVE